MTTDRGERTFAGGSSIVSGWAVLLNWSKAWIERIRSERRIRRGMDELMGVDDRMLADVGLSRGNLAYAVRYGHLPGRGPNGAQY
jgi:hypothetical protein